MRDVTSHAPLPTATEPAKSATILRESISGPNATAAKRTVSSNLAARMQKFEQSLAAPQTPGIPQRASFNGPSPSRNHPQFPGQQRKQSYSQKVVAEATKMIGIDQEISNRRSSVASQRESIGRERFEDNLPAPSGSIESLSPRIAEAIDTLRDTVLSHNPVSPVFVPLTLEQVQTNEIHSQLSKTNPLAGDTCKKCSKTVYAMEKIEYNEMVFHRGCLKCKHCGTTLKLGNVACLENEFFCKPHLRQLFALKGNYNEGFGRPDPKKDWVAHHSSQ